MTYLCELCMKLYSNFRENIAKGSPVIVFKSLGVKEHSFLIILTAKWSVDVADTSLSYNGFLYNSKSFNAATPTYKVVVQAAKCE